MTELEMGNNQKYYFCYGHLTSLVFYLFWTSVIFKGQLNINKHTNVILGHLLKTNRSYIMIMINYIQLAAAVWFLFAI